MPVSIPLWILALSVAFAVIFGKEVFGGTGMNIVNPALTARAFAFFAYPATMSGNKVWVAGAGKFDAISGETVLGFLAQNKEVPWTWKEMFVGTIPGSIGETSVLMILIGLALLLFTKVASWRIVISGLLGATFMGLVFNYFGANALMQFPWWKHLLVGGFAFGLSFMATDPVTAAQTRTGKWIYGFLIGTFALLIRVLNPAYPEGMMLAILLMNVVAPTIDYYVVQANARKRMKRLQSQKA
jgi:Na+-transporting NADH:ubiquinone oxidoreductase subunit B